MRIFLSPHLDDAVYSCGGTIHQLTEQGETVRIVTVMGGDPPTPLPQTPIINDLHTRWGAGPAPIAARRQEDQQAAAHLGAETQHMDTPDCVYRTSADGTPLYPSEESLWVNIHPQDPALHHLEGVRLPDNATHIYIPLGVGQHVDHLVVRRIGLAFHRLIAQVEQANPPALLFYPEYPYLEDAAAIETALATLPNALVIQQRINYLTHANIVAKIEGIRAYQSQVSTFWENEAALEKRVRAALVQRTDQPAEHFYQVDKG
jgi:LmbE family N-acetylglucosaminyl deacetylase